MGLKWLENVFESQRRLKVDIFIHVPPVGSFSDVVIPHQTGFFWKSVPSCRKQALSGDFQHACGKIDM